MPFLAFWQWRSYELFIFLNGLIFFQGYCDVFYKCRAVDAEGPLARLKNLLFNKQTLLSVAQWITVGILTAKLILCSFLVQLSLYNYCCRNTGGRFFSWVSVLSSSWPYSSSVVQFTHHPQIQRSLQPGVSQKHFGGLWILWGEWYILFLFFKILVLLFCDWCLIFPFWR